MVAQVNKVELELISPGNLSPESLALINTVGLEAYNIIINHSHIKQEINLYGRRNPNIIFQLIRGLISTLSTQDPNTIHYIIVREFLPKDTELMYTVVDMTARELLNCCLKLKLKLRAPKEFQEIFNTVKKECDLAVIESGNAETPSLEILNLEKTDSLFIKTDLFLWDKYFSDFLKTLGPEGKNAAKQLLNKFTNNYKDYENTGDIPVKFWLNLETAAPKNLLLVPALQVLVEVIWHDVIKKRIYFKKKNVPALTTKVQDDLTRLLSPKNIIKESIAENDVVNELQIFYQESLLGAVTMPAISQKIYDSVFNGVKKINTVTGHRIIRMFPTMSYNKMVNGQSDFRVLPFDRGAIQIAEHLGLQSRKQSSNVKEIIHAMAYFEFHGSQISGNLIQLSKYKSPVTHRQDEGYLITVGTPLLPYRTFDDNGLLIPLLQDPPLVNPNQTHASQYLLQMKIMEVFSNQSIQLVKDGAVRIPQDQWEEIAAQCKLNKEVLSKIQDRWTHDGDDGAKFLEKVDDDFYILGPEHYKALEFLRDQGELRIRQSQRGKKSRQIKEKTTFAGR